MGEYFLTIRFEITLPSKKLKKKLYQEWGRSLGFKSERRRKPTFGNGDKKKKTQLVWKGRRQRGTVDESVCNKPYCKTRLSTATGTNKN